VAVGQGSCPASRVTKLAGLQKRISTVAKTSMSGMTAVLNITAVAILNIVKGNNSIRNLLHQCKKL
jgi:hypothetical protein